MQIKYLLACFNSQGDASPYINHMTSEPCDIATLSCSQCKHCSEQLSRAWCCSATDCYQMVVAGGNIPTPHAPHSAIVYYYLLTLHHYRRPAAYHILKLGWYTWYRVQTDALQVHHHHKF